MTAALSADAAFWNRIARKYAARPVQDQAIYEEKLRRTRAVFPEGAEVLEFGCGTGSTALLHAPHVGRYRASDIAPEMIAIAREKLAAGGPHNVEFAVETLADRAADGPVWDAVLALNILHLLEDPEGACRTAFDILKPGGALVASTVTLGDRMVFARPLIWCLQMLGKAPRLNYVTGPQVEGWMKAAGFEIEDSWRPKGVAIFTIARKPG